MKCITPPRVPTRRKLLKAGIDILVYVPLPKSGCGSESFIHMWRIAQKGYDHPMFLGGPTAVNRNKIAQYMLRPENQHYTHVAMLDEDHLHPADVVEKMARWVLQDRKRLVIGSLNFRRTPPHDACLFQINEAGDRFENMTEWPAGLITTPLMGHGSILISREVFERVPPPWWAYPFNHAVEGLYQAEDSIFCQFMRDHNITMYCDTTITSPHLASMFVDERLYRAYRAHMAQEAAASES